MTSSTHAPAAFPREWAAQPVESSLGFRIGRVHRMLRSAWEDQIADLGLSAPQAALLRVVCERPGTGLRALARRLHTDATNAKRLADHLEDAGLLASAADPAHRQRRIFCPTEAGGALGREIAGRAASLGSRLSQMVGERELRHLVRVLASLEEALGGSGSTQPTTAEGSVDHDA